ncbi:MAG: hypothetical protein JHC95_15665 [Solirubrobacteraceae bacterium]|nr:hypothetical protein [Solirubrobacteraceae bacterium]
MTPKPSRTGDRAASIVLLICSGAIAAVLAFMGLFLVMGADSCGSGTDCNLDLFTTGWLLSMAAPVLGFAATLVLTIVRLARGQKAFWVPLAGTGTFILGFVGAVALTFSSVG